MIPITQSPADNASLKQANHGYGQKKPEKQPMPEQKITDPVGKYMVSVTGANAPSVAHNTLSQARNEAARLAAMPGQRHTQIIVSQVIGHFSTKAVWAWEGQQ